MSYINIKNENIKLDDREQDKIVENAKSLNISIEEYIYTNLLGKNFLVDRALELIEELPSGTRFNMKIIFGVEWYKWSNGPRMALGKKIKKESMLENSNFKADDTPDSSNTLWYTKE